MYTTNAESIYVRYKKAKIISKKNIVSYTKASMVLNYFIPCLQGYFLLLRTVV